MRPKTHYRTVSVSQNRRVMELGECLTQTSKLYFITVESRPLRREYANLSESERKVSNFLLFMLKCCQSVGTRFIASALGETNFYVDIEANNHMLQPTSSRFRPFDKKLQ